MDHAEVPAPKRPASDQGGSPFKKAKVEAIAATSSDELASSQPEAVPDVSAGAFVAVAPADHAETEDGASAAAKLVVANSTEGPAELVEKAGMLASTVAPLQPVPDVKEGAVPPTAVLAQPAGEPGEPS